MTDEQSELQQDKSTISVDGSPHQLAASARKAAPTWLQLLGWFWFLACVPYAGNALIHGKGAAAFFYLASGAMAWPPLWRWASRHDFRVSALVRTIFGVASCLLAGISMLPLHPQSQQAGQDAPATDNMTGRSQEPTPGISSDASRPTNAAPKLSDAERRTKVRELLADEKTLSRTDYEGRLEMWKEIVKFAPGNAEYAREMQSLSAKIQTFEYAKENPEAGVVVEQVRPRREGFGAVLVIDITLRNDSLSNLKDFQITCESQGNSGTVMDTNTRTLYETLEARTTHTFRNLNMGLLNSQAAKMDCRVTGASIQ